MVLVQRKTISLKIPCGAYFNDHLEFRQDVFNQVKSLFDSYGVKMPAINRHQAEVPSTCITLMNKKGTAPGICWFRRNNKVIVSMPGVPYEMKYLMEQEVLPRVKTEFETPELVYKNHFDSRHRRNPL